MNRLDPDLKRLLRRSRTPEAAARAEAPFGFAGRVVAQWSGTRSDTKEPGLQRLFATVVWMSCLMLVGCGLFLFRQSRTPPLASDFSNAAQYVANTLVP